MPSSVLLLAALLALVAYSRGCALKCAGMQKLLPFNMDELSDGAMYVNSDIAMTLMAIGQIIRLQSGGGIHTGNNIKTLPNSGETNNYVFSGGGRHMGTALLSRLLMFR